MGLLCQFVARPRAALDLGCRLESVEMGSDGNISHEGHVCHGFLIDHLEHLDSELPLWHALNYLCHEVEIIYR